MQLLDRIMLDPVTDFAATQDCPNYDQDSRSASADCLQFANIHLPLFRVLRILGMIGHCRGEFSLRALKSIFYLPALDKAS